MTARPSLARTSALLAVLTAASGFLGIFRDAAIAAVYGASAELDAYLVAQGLMNLVLGLLAGAVAKAVVPPVARFSAAGDTPAAHRTARVALTATVGVLLVASVAMALAADVVVTVLAPGFPPEVAELAASLTRIVLLATVLIAATNVLAAVAQAHGRFFWSGIQGVPFNLVMIAAAVLLAPDLGIDALAVGFVVGSLLRLLVQLPALRAVGLRLRPSLRLRDPGFREVLRLTPPLLLASALTNVNTLVDRAVGSGQGAGTISALSFGWRLVALIDTLLVVAVVSAAYPAMAALGEATRRQELRGLLDRALRGLLVVLAPVTVVLVVAAEPLVRVVFGRGDFDERAVELTALATVAFAGSLLGIGVRELASRACFAVGDSRLPVLTAVLGVSINVAGDLTLGRAYGVVGLAASTTLSLVVSAVVLLLLLHRRHAGVALRPLTASALRVGGAGTVAGLLVSVAVRATDAGGPGTSTAGALVLLAATAAGTVAVYLAVLVALRGPEPAELARTVRVVLRHR